LNAAFIIQLVELLQASAEDIIHVIVPVINLHQPEIAARTQMLDQRDGYSLSGINRPAMIFVESNPLG